MCASRHWLLYSKASNAVILPPTIKYKAATLHGVNRLWYAIDFQQIQKTYLCRLCNILSVKIFCYQEESIWQKSSHKRMASTWLSCFMLCFLINMIRFFKYANLFLLKIPWSHSVTCNKTQWLFVYTFFSCVADRQVNRHTHRLPNKRNGNRRWRICQNSEFNVHVTVLQTDRVLYYAKMHIGLKFGEDMSKCL